MSGFDNSDDSMWAALPGTQPYHDDIKTFKIFQDEADRFLSHREGVPSAPGSVSREANGTLVFEGNASDVSTINEFGESKDAWSLFGDTELAWISQTEHSGRIGVCDFFSPQVYGPSGLTVDEFCDARNLQRLGPSGLTAAESCAAQLRGQLRGPSGLTVTEFLATMPQLLGQLHGPSGLAVNEFWAGAIKSKL